MSQNPIATQSFVKTPAGTIGVNRGDAQGSSYTAQRHGERYAAAYAGTLGFAANQAGATLSVGLATTYVGLCLSNPAGSGVNLAVQRVKGLCNVAVTAVTAFGLIAGFAAGGVTAHTTPATVQSSIIGGAATGLKGLVDTACTLVGTPFWADWIAEGLAATTVLQFDQNYQGALLVPPGGYVAIGSSLAGPTSGFFGSILWEENPV